MAIIWSRRAITNVGRALIADCQVNHKALNITSCCLSSHDYSQNQLEDVTALSDIEQSVNINEKYKTDDDAYKLSANFNNNSLATGYTLRTYGVYANNGDADVLLLIAIADNEEPVPAISDGLWQCIINSNVKISGDVNVTINVDLSADASIQYVNELVAEVQTQVTELKNDIQFIIPAQDPQRVDKKETIVTTDPDTIITDGQTLETYEVAP